MVLLGDRSRERERTRYQDGDNDDITPNLLSATDVASGQPGYMTWSSLRRITNYIHALSV